MSHEFTLPNLSCGHCVRAVTQALQRVDPQAQVFVELEARRVRIESSLPAARLRQTLAEAGYPVALPGERTADSTGRDAAATASS